MGDPDDYTLQEFVEKVDLPQRAKVTAGYYEEGDEDGNREFSNGELIELRRILCPFVDVVFTHPKTNADAKTTISTRIRTPRFVVATHQEANAAPRPRLFRSVRELTEVWPSIVQVQEDYTISASGAAEPRSVSRGDELRLIREVKKDDGSGFLEVKNSRAQELALLPIDFRGLFIEVEDRKSYLLHDVVDFAKVPRFLRLDQPEPGSKAITALPGLPSNFCGILRMQKPNTFVEIVRIVTDENTGKQVATAPFLVPLDVDIQVAARDSSYIPLPCKTLHLSVVEQLYGSKMPIVARIVEWTEESTVLQNHATRAGDHVLIYSIQTVDKVVAQCGKKYFLIPVMHRGRFRRVNKATAKLTEIKLNSLEKQSFPFEVKYSGADYRNLPDERLPETDTLTFHHYLKADRCVLVSKLYGNVIGSAFHLPLRTKITVQVERRLKKTAEIKESTLSHLDSCSEEISGELYNEIMRDATYEWVPAGVREGTPTRTRTHRRPPPPPPPPRRPSSQRLEGRQPDAVRRPQPPLPVRQQSEGKTTDDSSDEEDYDYVDMPDYIPNEYELGSGGIAIPSNGNICSFSPKQMLYFLKENHAPQTTIDAWKRDGLDGKAFAAMDDDELKRRNIASSVVQFFRDRSRMQLVLYQL